MGKIDDIVWSAALHRPSPGEIRGGRWTGLLSVVRVLPSWRVHWSVPRLNRVLARPSYSRLGYVTAEFPDFLGSAALAAGLAW